MAMELKYLRRGLAGAGSLLLMLAGTAQANFDEAVNHYLRGFDACNEANGLIRSGQIGPAKQRIQVYLKHLREAERIDASIKTTAERGMPSNLQFCERVLNTIEVEEATPVMNQAIAACDQAKDALDANDPQTASAKLTAFREGKDKALQIAPKMLDQFAIASQVRRCERLESRVARSSQKAEQLQASIDAAREESEAYVRVCEQAVKTLKDSAVDDAVLRAANQAIDIAESHKANAQGEEQAQKAFQDSPDSDAAKLVKSNLSKGDACLATAKSTVSGKTRELANIKREFDRVSASIKSLQNQCNTAKRSIAGEVTEARYESARAQVQKAQEQERSIRAQLRGSDAYATYSNWPQVGEINEDLGDAAGCVAEANASLGSMFAKVQDARQRAAQQAAQQAAREREEAARQARQRAEAARLEQQRAEAERKAREKAEAERLERLSRAERERAEAERAARERAEAEAAQAAQAAAAAAAALAEAAEAAAEQAREEAAAEQARRTEVIRSGVGLTSVNQVNVDIRFDALPPPYAVVYAHDDNKPPSNMDITISRAGFDQDKYFVGTDTTLQVINADNALHRLPVVDEYHDMKDTLVRLYPRQRQRAKITWPVDRIVELRSERGALSVSQIITLPTSSYKVMDFIVGENVLKNSYSIPSSKVTKVTLLMPKHDPLEVDFSLSSNVSMPILQNGQPVGVAQFTAK